MKKQNIIFGTYVSVILAITAFALYNRFDWSLGSSLLVFPGSLLIAFGLTFVTESNYLRIENDLTRIYDAQTNGIIGDQKLLSTLAEDTSSISWENLFLSIVGFIGLFFTADQVIFWIGYINNFPEIDTFVGYLICLAIWIVLYILFHYSVKSLKVLVYPNFKIKNYKYNVETLRVLLPPELMKEVTQEKINLDTDPYSQFFYVDTENSISKTSYLAALYLETITERIIINVQEMKDFKNKKKTDQVNELESIKKYLKLSDSGSDH